jgi:hypothetical protein
VGVRQWLRFAVALLAAVLFIAGPLFPAGWLVAQSRTGRLCESGRPRGAPGWRQTTEWIPPSITCTYRLPRRLLVVRHEAAYRDVAAALMAMAVVLAIAAYAAPARRTDEAASAHG